MCHTTGIIDLSNQTYTGLGFSSLEIWWIWKQFAETTRTVLQTVYCCNPRWCSQQAMSKIMWIIYVPWPQPFLKLAKSPELSGQHMHFSSNCTIHSHKVLKSLQTLCFWWRSHCIAMVTLVFISDTETVQLFCAKKLKPILGYNLKPVCTNRLHPITASSV